MSEQKEGEAQAAGIQRMEARALAAALIAWRNATPEEWAEEARRLRSTLDNASRALEAFGTTPISRPAAQKEGAAVPDGVTVSTAPALYGWVDLDGEFVSGAAKPDDGSHWTPLYTLPAGAKEACDA